VDNRLLRRILASGVLLLAGACSSTKATTASSTASTTIASNAPATTATALTPTSAAATTVGPTTTSAAATTTTTVAPAAAAKPVAAVCPVGPPTAIMCKTVAVPLDPAKPDGTKINLAVTIRQADPSKWTSPILLLLSGTGALPSVVFGGPSGSFFDNLPGHDLIAIDARGAGRSDGATTCADLADYNGELNTWRLSPAASAAVRACIANAVSGAVPLASILDHAVLAADVVAVRHALGIDKWIMWTSNGHSDIGMHVLKIDAAAVTAFVARDPNAVGAGASGSTIADAFDRFTADCAKSPKCATNGDLKELLGKALDRLKTPLTTKTVDKATGAPVVLDAVAIQGGVRSVMFNPDLEALLPGLIAGLAAGSADELVAGFYASQSGGDNAALLATNCQTAGYGFPPLTAPDGDHPGLFAGFTNKRFCDAVGPVPQMIPPPKITSDIPVLVFLSSHEPRTSEAIAKSLFSGFSHTSVVTAVGVSSALNKGPCFYKVVLSFADSPTTPVDTSCLSGPDGNLFT
jgi:pimeloyl-ACP methyl ester carboxylesterase